MGAFLAPDGFAVFEPNVVHRAPADALPAAGAGTACLKCVGFHEETVEDRVDRATHEAVVERVAGRGESLSRFQTRNNARNIRLCLLHDLPGFRRVRCIEHGDIVFRHDDLRRSHAAQIFLPGKLAVVLCRVPDFAAAVHHEPDALRSGQFRLDKPVSYDPRDTPRIRRGHDDHVSARLDGGMVARLDLDVQVDDRIPQRFRDPLRNITAVARPRKTEDHRITPSLF